MPNRILRDGILTSERVNKLAPQAEILYRRLMSVVDDFGRFTAHAGLVRSACYPLRTDEVREADISRWLTEVQLAGLIVLYAVDGKRYLEMCDFRQQVRATKSKYPPPEMRSTCAAHDKQMRADAHLDGDVVEDVDVDEDENSSEPLRAASEQEVLVFSCVGTGPKEWRLLQSKVDEWKDSYPGVDVLSECRKARQWCIDNPTKRKTFKGMAGFISRWLARAQNDGKRTASTGVNSHGTKAARVHGTENRETDSRDY